ncbi:probable 1,4-beta-D-glucan cellobiohydrolase C [Folsomia candida]|uniref:Uncharacterized protein n=1 Tax=Folsomia candida TaxID=158441 RepID=A0A226F7Y5_FOLCA|nr:probable 1,4-beta-D-glucan cellobiohydrolase C [Folsomia candida]OXA64976.1 hypothetical protein Fcan01_03304 [Folsomia candida]
MKSLLPVLFVGVLAVKLCSAAACKQPTNIPPGSHWVGDEDCKMGTTYDTVKPPYHCHCWEFCGYICDPKNGTSTTTKPTTTTTMMTTTTTTTKPGCKHGSPWYPKPNTRCICKSLNKQQHYECKTTNTTTTSTTAATTTTTVAGG